MQRSVAYHRAPDIWLYISFSDLYSESSDQHLDEDWPLASQSKQERGRQSSVGNIQEGGC